MQQIHIFDTIQIEKEKEVYYYKVIAKYNGEFQNVSLGDTKILFYAPLEQNGLQLIVIAFNTGKLVKK